MKLIVILGPTSTGKTSLALNLCEKFNGEIVSCDSRQVYKFMNIGTGKLPIDRKFNIQKFAGFWRVNNIPIYMYDVVTPNIRYSVYDYSKKAKNELESIYSRGKTPLLVGGTGFYIDVLVGRKGVSNVPPNLKLRNELESKTLLELQNILKTLSKSLYNNVDLKNKVRLIRTIEIAQGSENEIQPSRFQYYKPTFIGLTAVRSFLYQRIDIWVETIVEKGLILEAKALIEMGYENSVPMKSLVYSTTLDYLRGNISLENMKERIKFDLHGYIRRQLTWFNRNPDVKWFNIEEKGFDTGVFKKVESYLDDRK